MSACSHTRGRCSARIETRPTSSLHAGTITMMGRSTPRLVAGRVCQCGQFQPEHLHHLPIQVVNVCLYTILSQLALITMHTSHTVNMFSNMLYGETAQYVV